MDARLREAQEASQLLEDLETRPRNDPAIGSREYNGSADHYDQDPMETSYSQDQSESLKPLLSDDANRIQVQNQPFSFMSMISQWKACSTYFLFLGLAALLFVLVLLCTGHLANGIHVLQTE